MSTQPTQRALGGAAMRSRETAPATGSQAPAEPGRKPATAIATAELFRSLAEVKGQAQFLLYLADQIEESLEQLTHEGDACHGAFLCKILGMYSSQLESKHQGLGDRIAETCQELYVTVREYDHV